MTLKISRINRMGGEVDFVMLRLRMCETFKCL
jgi:hypothetical protein